MSDECGDCRFWIERTDHGGQAGGGYCRRYPPSFPSGLTVRMTRPLGMEYEVDLQGRLNDAWPMVHRQEWCGEWSPKP